MGAADPLTDLLVRFGPPFLGALTFFETATLAGLFVPAGVAFLLAAFLATQGTFALEPVVAWAMCGALLGDSVGYALGRRGDPTKTGGRGILGRALAKLGPQKLRLLAGAPLYSVSLARVISFLRTVAPMAAGATGLAYGRFLLYNVFGVILWAASYAAVGTLAGESWKRVSQYVGVVWGVVFVLVVAVTVAMRRKRENALAERRPLSVGLTGNAGSGKSTVASYWRNQGIPVVDADQLAREAVAAGSEGLASVTKAFGPSVLTSDGTLDRERMRSLVFSDPAKRLQLEAILHPRIALLREEWVAARAEDGHGLVVSEIPLLFEADLAPEFDVVVLVHVPRRVSVERLTQNRALTTEEAEAILDAQMPSESKVEMSDYVIRNDTSTADLRDIAKFVLKQLRKRAAKRSASVGAGAET